MRSDKTDEKMAELLDRARPAYGDTSRERALSEMSRAYGERPVRPPGRRGRWVLRTATATAIIALGLGLFLLPQVRPVSAEAALGRVVGASEGVHTSHLVLWMALPGGMRETHTSWYDEGKWRLETWRGPDLVRVQVHDGEQSHFYSADDNTAYLNASDSPFGTPFNGFTVGAMLESLGEDRDVAMEATRTEDGRPADRLTITTWNQHTPTERTPGERLILLADPETDLPLSLEVYVSVGDEWQLVGGTETVEYNLTVDPTLFVLDYPPNAHVVDRGKLSQEWQQRYDRGLDRIDTAEGDIVLRDFQVTALGDVAAIWTGTSPFVEVTLADSLGTSYLRNQQGFQAHRDPCAWFIPVSPPSSRPSWYALVIGEHGFRVSEPVIVDGADPMYPPRQHVRGEAAFISPGGAGAEMSRARVRAEYWRSHGDPEQAVSYYEKMVGIAKTEYHATYVNADTWIAIGELYEETGRREKALRAYERGLQALEASPNRNTPWERDLADKLRAKLERLR
jgi:outer membrane lipoprotein-sorting protein